MQSKKLEKLLFIYFMVLFLLFPFSADAGSLDSSAAPTNSGSAMYTLEDIYNRLNDRTAATKRAGSFTEPGAGPASTGKTLDDVMDLVDSRSPVEKTGQTTSYDGSSLDDGGLEKGVSWPSPRFTDNGDGTVTDNLTGLIWLGNANCYGLVTWATAITNGNALANGTCSLADSSSAGDWRLPNVKELSSLIDFAFSSPALSDAAGTVQWSSGDAFTGVQANLYWSSTTLSANTPNAWYVNLFTGDVANNNKTTTSYVWPVRGGQ